MNIKIKQNDFYHGIQIVNRAVSNKSTLNILKGIYIEAKKDKGIKLISNDLEIGIEYWIDADIKKEGSIVLPATELSNIIRELPNAEISFIMDEELYQVNISCLNSKFTLKGFQGDEFPQLPEVEEPIHLNINSNIFKKMIEEVKFAVSKDQTQPSMTGGLMVLSKNNISLVTTNTYRLAYNNIEIKNSLDKEIKIILPDKTLNELNNLLDGKDEDIEILLNNNYVRFNFSDIIFISRLIEGKFPNYKTVIPNDFKSRVKVDRKELLNAVKRVSLIARLDSNVISININKDKMSISSSSSDYGNAQEIIEVELEGIEQNIDIDANYMIDVLKILNDETINLMLISPLKSLTVKKQSDDDYIYLIMPVRPGA